MADTQTTPWEEIEIKETVSEADQAAANTLDQEKQPGYFLCEVVESNAVVKELKELSCYAASLKMKVHKILELNQPVIGEDKKLVLRDGVAVGVIRPVPESLQEEVDALYVGSLINDEVRLFHPREKEIFKKRRLFVAQRLGLVNSTTTELTSSMWANAVGKFVIVKTVWNIWINDAKETQKTVKVNFFSGYDYATNVPDAVSSGVQGGVEVEDEAFDI
ncbi:MAG: hypothetical protein GY710_26250 [Desulfobacteraceae bacterium]|nr:hypothetical protein [Desulfobacteraceae bacterium]